MALLSFADSTPRACRLKAGDAGIDLRGTEAPHSMLALTVDIAEPATVTAAVAAVLERLGRAGIPLNAAATIIDGGYTAQ